MNAIQPFIFDQTLVVRTLVRDGDPWFVAIDVARALGYENTRDAVLKHCRRATDLDFCQLDRRDSRPSSDLDLSDSQMSSSPGSPVPPTDSGDREPNHGGLRHAKIIPESDVYRLIMRSNLPSAERFQDWVCEDVLPAIRKSGGYFLAQGSDTAFLLQETDRELAALKARRHALSLEIRRLDKRRFRLGGAPERLPWAGQSKLTADMILDAIPPEGIRVSALQRSICEKHAVVRTTFYAVWRNLRSGPLIRHLPNGSISRA